jgi:prepilin-type N-terminal cleavage/methylation domain-containing protein
VPADGHNRAGFTMIETLTVLIIVAVLIGLTVGVTDYVKRTSREKKAMAALEAFHNALEEHKIRHGAYPQTLSAEALAEWLAPGVGANDPWGNAYRYAVRSEHSYDLSCDGPDGRPGTPDDVTSGR